MSEKLVRMFWCAYGFDWSCVLADTKEQAKERLVDIIGEEADLYDFIEVLPSNSNFGRLSSLALELPEGDYLVADNYYNC